MKAFAQDTPVYMLLHQLMHLSRYQAVKHLEELELKPGQAGILFILTCRGRMSQRELAEEMGVTAPSMTVALKKLEDSGYILREPDSRDQRITRIRLSDKGESCVDDIKTAMKDMENILYQGISLEEKMLLKRLLLQMQENLLRSKDFGGMDMKVIMKHIHPPVEDRL